MLTAWMRPHRRHQYGPAEDSSRYPKHYSCTSFKDIQDLLNEDPISLPDSPRRPSLLHRARSSSVYSPRAAAVSSGIFSAVDIPNAGHGGVVLYFTSLRIVRKTFEECRTVRSILRGYRIQIDERDLSMDSKFQDELQEIFGTKKVSLPKVFIGGRYIGGTEEIKQMQESDELMKMIGELEPSDGTYAGICGECGGQRFVLCELCNGSHKIFSKYGFKSCTACSVYGLVRCPACFPAYRRRTSP